MQVVIHTEDFKLTDALNEHIQRKLQFALSRIEPHIKSISILLNDVNGPKGGVDKHCRLTVALDNMENIVINDTQADLYHAIDRAMQRLNHTAVRKLSRWQKRQKQLPRNIPLSDFNTDNNQTSI